MKLKNKLLLLLPLSLVSTSAFIAPLVSCYNNDETNNNSNMIVAYDPNLFNITFDNFANYINANQNKDNSTIEKQRIYKIIAQGLLINPNEINSVTYDKNTNQIIVTFKNNNVFKLYNPYNYLYEKNNVFNDSNLTNLIDSNILTFPSEIQTISVGEIYNKTSYPIVYNNNTTTNNNKITSTIKQIFDNYFSTNPSNTTQTPIETIYSRYKNDLTFIFEYIINEILSKSNQQIFNLKPFLAINNNQNNFDVFFQVKNVSNEPINLFIDNITLNPNSLLSLKLSFVINANPSNIQPNIYYFNNSYKIGYCINNANLQYQIDNNLDIKPQSFQFNIPYSYSINTEVKDVSNKYDVYNYHTTITNNIKSLDQNLFIQNLKQQIQTYIQNDFNNTKTILVNVFQILEFINPFTVNSVNNSIEFSPLTIKQFLTGIGNQIFNILKNINEPLAVVLGNLFSDQTPTFSSNFLPNPVASNATTSGFLYNSFNAIIALLNNLYDKTNSKVILEVRKFLFEQLGNKNINGYNQFITNLPALKSTVSTYLNALNISLEQKGVILSLLDSFSSNDNIWTLIDKNIITILDLVIALTSNTNNTPNQQAINNILINIKNLIIHLRNGSNNTLETNFWNIINQNTINDINSILDNIKTLLPNLQSIITILKPILSNCNNITTIRTILYDITYPTFTNKIITKMSEYFNTEFVFDNSVPLNFSTINFNNTNKITGNISYSYTLNSGFKINLTNLKTFIGNVIPIVNSIIKSNINIVANTKIKQQLSFNNSCLKPYVKDKKLYWFITGLKQFTDKQTLNNFLPLSNLILSSLNIFWKDSNINIYTDILLNNNDNNIYNYFYTDIINYDYCININVDKQKLINELGSINTNGEHIIDQNTTLYNNIMKNILLGKQNINDFYYSFNIKYIYKKGFLGTKTLEITPAIKVLKYDSKNNKYTFDNLPITIKL